MASHVVVIDISFRRVTVKTTPGTYLSSVLEEACSKFGLKSEQYGLKNGNKQIDLSRTMRMSNLSAGAKLNLVQASRSPTVISVALQLPVEEESSGGLARLTDKFPSNLPVWQILRRFESGVAGGASSANPRHNFTQRATPFVADGKSSGSGRLCYEMPVVNVMGRELTSFVDLQKTLGQLGFNSGSCLLRLGYRNTQQPLEEAMADISRFFKEDEQPTQPAATEPESSQKVFTQATKADIDMTSGSTMAAGEAEESQRFAEDNEPEVIPDSNDSVAPTSSDISRDKNPATSGISIFAPPSSATPAAASQINYNEADYVPTVAHAHLHQARLTSETRNKKLLSDDELAAREQSRFESLISIKDVVVRLRFPDETQAQKSFDREATTSTLYAFCRELMNRPSKEDFYLRAIGAKGNAETVQEDSRKLIQDLAWQGRVLVTVVWADNVSSDTRRGPALKEQYRQQAESLRVDLQQISGDPEDKGKVVQTGTSKKQGSGIKQDVESKMRGFLKGLSKK